MDHVLKLVPIVLHMIIIQAHAKVVYLDPHFQEETVFQAEIQRLRLQHIHIIQALDPLVLHLALLGYQPAHLNQDSVLPK